MPTPITRKLREAEKVRDKIVHGKSINNPNMRDAIYDVLEYATLLNEHLEEKAGFKPFGDLRGFKGRGTPLDANTTRWLLKGMGFTLS